MPSVRNDSTSGIKRTVWPERQKFLPATAIHPHLPAANIRTRTVLRNGEPPDAVSAGIGSPAQRSLLSQGRRTEHIRDLRVLVCKVGKPRSISARISPGGGITKVELIRQIADKAGIKQKDAEKAVNAFTEAVTEALKNDDKVALVGFGIFEVSERAARTGRNPQTGEPVEIAASKLPKFKAGKALKDAIK